MMNSENGFLCLETGECYPGLFHGGDNRAGEVVFNTSHTGYEEIATDPSYYSQIVVMTAPMQGNYGADRASWESRQLWIEGFVCLQLQISNRDQGWSQRLRDSNIPCLTELDTRAIAFRLRENGTPWGAIVKAGSTSAAKEISSELVKQRRQQPKDWVFATSRGEVEARQGRSAKGPRIAVLDLGTKENILRELQSVSREVIVFPSRSSAQEILATNPDGILLSNGPGDPADVQVTPSTVRELIGRKPIFGICMGHQILGLALGAKTYRFKFGHRGSNHPIRDELLGRTYITAQNHGYAVVAESLPTDAKVTQVNLNDNTVAGFYSPQRNFLGIQYHPESHPGPHDASGLFGFFINTMLQKAPTP